jgi:hypothetical protein
MGSGKQAYDLGVRLSSVRIKGNHLASVAISPVEVLVNGKSVAAINQIGVPAIFFVSIFGYRRARRQERRACSSARRG